MKAHMFALMMILFLTQGNITNKNLGKNKLNKIY